MHSLYISGSVIFGALLFGLLAYLSWPKFEARLESRHKQSAESSHGEKDDGLVTTIDRPGPEIKPQDRPEPGIKTPGTYIYATPDRIVIWTTIKLVDKHGRETYLKDLTSKNFSVLESHSGNAYEAPVLEVKSSHVPVRAILVIDKSGSMNEASGIDAYKKWILSRRQPIYSLASC